MRTSPAVSVTGLVLAWVGYLVSLTPTMVPRTTAVQVAMSTLLPLTGYAIGATLGALARALTGDRRVLENHRLARRAALGSFAVAVLGAVGLTAFALQWQTDLADAVGWGLPSWPLVIGLAPLLTVLLVFVGRAFRLAGRSVGHRWRRVVPSRRLATALGAISVAVVTVGVLAGALALLNRAYVQNDAETSGQTQPTSALRSGSPDSLVAWETLGRQGRMFVGEGPSAQTIEGFSGTSAEDPIRVYVGRQQGATPQDRAALLVDELERTGGFDRESVVVVVTSGLGSVHPVSAQSAEYVASPPPARPG